MKIAALAATAALVVAIAGPAKADQYFALTGQFDDGGTLDGFFTINVYGYVGDYSLTTSGGGLPSYTFFRGQDYPEVCGGGYDHTNCLAYATALPGTPGYLQVAFEQPFQTLVGSVDPVVVGAGGPSFESWDSYSPRYLISGVASVPEASTWAAMALGFAGLGLLGGSRKIASTAGLTQS